MRKIALLLIAAALTGCNLPGALSPDVASSNGWSDGYAAGYNTTCKIRSTLIAGTWSNKHYTSGYYAGYEAGADACRHRNR